MLPTKALYLIMKEAIPESIAEYRSNYEARLKTQKFIYLFSQIWGEDLYNHSWYLAGPYSSTLTHQIYENLFAALDESQDEWDTLSLSKDATRTISQVKTLVLKAQELDNKNLSESKSYELVASVWYIANKKKVDTTDAIESELILNKPHFKDVTNLKEIISLVISTMKKI